MTVPQPDCHWSIGIAASIQELYEDWLVTNTYSIVTSDGSQPDERVDRYGSFMDSEYNTEFIELAYWYSPSHSVTAVDALIGAMIGDGDEHKLARNAIIDGSFYHFAGLIAPNDEGVYMVDIALAHKFQDNPEINQDCTIEANFGGGPCDPENFEAELFQMINLVRTNPTAPVIIDRLVHWRDSLGVGNMDSIVMLDSHGDGKIIGIEVEHGF